MRKLFAVAALYCCGALIAHVPSRTSSANDRQIQARYYFLSLSSLARGIHNSGVIDFVNHDGTQAPYTHKNFTGVKPVSDATLVCAHFGRAPGEVRLLVNRSGYSGKETPNILLDATRPVPSVSAAGTKKDIG